MEKFLYTAPTHTTQASMKKDVGFVSAGLNVDLYDRDPYLPMATAKLADFFGRVLAAPAHDLTRAHTG